MSTQRSLERRIGSPTPSRRSRCATVWLLCAATTTPWWGCAQSAEIKSQAPKRVVAIGEFSTPPRQEVDDASPATPEAVVAEIAGSPSQSAVARPTPPQPPRVGRASVEARPLLPGQEAIIESVIGQVSGRPIFADAFLEPISDQLRSESERLGREEFIVRARQIISDRLNQVVLNELFIAEAEASLTQQQQMGLLAFLRDLQERNIAERGGTLFGAQQKIAEEQEMTLEEFERAQKDDALIRNLLFRRVTPRVIVSWRDVQREYELRKAEFNPPATVTLRRLVLDPAEHAEVIGQVRARFADGAAFNDVVEQLNLQEFTSLVGGDGRFRMTSDSMGDLELAEPFRAALAKIPVEAGQRTEEITTRAGAQWLYVERIEQPPVLTIYDVQDRLISELQARRFNEEYRKYIDSILAKGIYDEIDTMARRALAVAIVRYGR